MTAGSSTTFERLGRIGPSGEGCQGGELLRRHQKAFCQAVFTGHLVQGTIARPGVGPPEQVVRTVEVWLGTRWNGGQIIGEGRGNGMHVGHRVERLPFVFPVHGHRVILDAAGEHRAEPGLLRGHQLAGHGIDAAGGAAGAGIPQVRARDTLVLGDRRDQRTVEPLPQQRLIVHAGDLPGPATPQHGAAWKPKPRRIWGSCG